MRLGMRHHNGELSVMDEYNGGNRVALQKKKNKRHGLVVVNAYQFYFGELIGKIWSEKCFISNADTHFMIQPVCVATFSS